MLVVVLARVNLVELVKPSLMRREVEELNNCGQKVGRSSCCYKIDTHLDIILLM